MPNKKDAAHRKIEGRLERVRVVKAHLMMVLTQEEDGKSVSTEIVFELQNEGILDDLVEAIEDLREHFAEDEGE
jgi:hypothetical protein